MPRKKKRSVNERLIIITATSLILTLTLLGYYLSQYRKADLLYKEIADIAFEVTTSEKAGTDNSNHDSADNSINHAALKARNGDYVGWLQVDGTDISYPIVQSKEELFYLRRDFNKNYSIAGTVFMDYRNKKDFTDTNTMLYGHNMHDGSMFAQMKRFLEEDFFKENRDIKVITPEGEYRYEIFAVYEVKASDVPNTPGLLNAEETQGFLARIKKLARFSRETAVSEQSNILTLATCGYNIKDARIVIHAKRIDT